ncbi:MAG TPA: hypothetical protein VFC51_03355 [Chloroflexota bacterium]|nr:hypothetical protein [Chloroflexota bacterium]
MLRALALTMLLALVVAVAPASAEDESNPDEANWPNDIPCGRLESLLFHVHEAPIPRTFTLGDFFAVWGEPLSETQVGEAHGEVFAYVDGARVDGDPSDIELADREVIQLNVGTDTPAPEPYAFPARYD